MVKILKSICIVVIAVVLIDKAFTFLFTNIFFKHTFSGESGGTINYVIEKKKELDFLIIGASRAKHGIDPALLTSLGTQGYNLGINGTTVLNSSLIFDILLAHGVRTKTLIVQTDLSDYVTDTEAQTLDQIKRLYPYNTPLVQEYVARVGWKEEVKYFFGLYRFNRKVANIGFNFLKRNTVTDTNGYVGLSNTGYPPEAHVISDHYVYNGNGLSAEAIARIKALCDAHGIKLIVVIEPSYGNVLYNKTGQEAMNADLRQKGITSIIDFSNIETIPELAGAENWRDAIHLNSTGAEKFSKVLNGVLVKELRKK